MTKAKFSKGYSAYITAFKKWSGFNLADRVGKQELMKEWTDYAGKPGNLRLKDGETAKPAVMTPFHRQAVPNTYRVAPTAPSTKPGTAKIRSPSAPPANISAGYVSRTSSSVLPLSSSQGLQPARVRQLVEGALKNSHCLIRTSCINDSRITDFFQMLLRTSATLTKFTGTSKG